MKNDNEDCDTIFENITAFLLYFMILILVVGSLALVALVPLLIGYCLIMW